MFINILVQTPDTIVGSDSTSSNCLEGFFSASATGGILTYDYDWTVDGTTYSTASFSHTFSAAGPYPYTLIISDGFSVSDTINGTIDVAYDISGKVTTHLGAPLIGQPVYLIEYDTTGGGTLTAIDTTTTDSAGNYWFCGVSATALYVKAAPDAGDYPDDLPTYFLSSATWGGADNVLAGGIPAIGDFMTLGGVNPGGPGFIGGLVSLGAGKTYGAGDPVEGLPIYLYSIDDSEYRGYTETNADGYFSFTDLPEGNYSLIPDQPGISSAFDSVPDLMISTSEGLIQDSLLLSLEPDQLIWFELTSVAPGVPTDGLLLDFWPNPAREEITLNLGVSRSGTVELELIDMTGKTIHGLLSAPLNPGTHQAKLNLKKIGVLPGVYFLKMTSNGTVKLRKIVLL